MSVRDIDRSLERWEMNAQDVHRRMILAPTPRERERWHAVWLLAQGWTALAAAKALERDPHTIGPLRQAQEGLGLRRGWSGTLSSRPVVPPALEQTQQAGLKGTVRQPPSASGMEMANWHWRVVRRFVWERFGLNLSRSSCLNYPRLQEGRLCTGWDSATSVPRSGWSRPMSRSGRPSLRSMPPLARRPN